MGATRRPWTHDNGNTLFQSSIPKVWFFKKLLKILSYRYCGKKEKGKKNVLFFLFFFVNSAARGEFLFFSSRRTKLSNTLIKSAHATIDLRSRHRLNPRPTSLVSGKANGCRWRPRRYQVDRRSRRRELARGVIRSSPKPEKKLPFAIREGSRKFVKFSSSFYRRA